jgi:uridine phosphorylase
VPFPNVEGKHRGEAIFRPQDFIAYLKTQNAWNDFPIPEGVVLVYQRWFLNRVVANEAAAGRLLSHPIPASLLSFHMMAHDGMTYALTGGFGIGSPAAAAIMEELIALGVGRFIAIGTAGGLQNNMQIGDIVLCDRAIRDEGVSHHYLPPAKYSTPSAKLTERLQDELERQGLRVRVGTTWTIDAPYRETVEELRQYQEEGVLTVDMEAAALASVAAYRGVDFAAALVISDSLADLVWDPQFRSTAVALGLESVYHAAVAALVPTTNGRSSR